MTRSPSALLVVGLLSLAAGPLAGCGGDRDVVRAARPGASGVGEASAAASAPLVIFLGDSLTAGLGLEEGEAYPALVEERLIEDGLRARVINAGVSGDTTAGGLARLDWLLDQGPRVVVVGLGANDGLRGAPLPQIEENLRQIVVRARAAGARVVLLGMKIPPSYGLDYARGFERLYPRIADELDVAFVPFLLEDVAARPALNLPDRLHPNARGHAVMAKTVYPYVEDQLE